MLGAAVNRRKIELVFRGAQGEHQVEDLFVHFVGAAVEFIHLIDYDDGLLPHFQRLLQHETRLRHRTFKGIDQQQHAVGHVEHTLHLTAEIGVARSVDNIDFHALIGNRHILGQDGDSPLPLQIIVVQNQFTEVFRLAGQLGLVNHAVHEGRLAVVHVGDDRYVSDCLHTA